MILWVIRKNTKRGNVMNEKKLNDKQRQVIEWLNDSIYTVQYIEYFINQKDVNTFNNAPAACIISGCYGFLSAVDCYIKEFEK